MARRRGGREAAHRSGGESLGARAASRRVNAGRSPPVCYLDAMIAPSPPPSSSPPRRPRRADARALAQKVQAFYERTRDLEARFQQTYTYSGFGRRQVSAGTLKVKKPGMMRWDYETPAPKTVAVKGSRLVQFEPEENQAYVDERFDATAMSAAVTFLLGKGDLAREFDLSVDGSGALVLHPEGGGSARRLDRPHGGRRRRGARHARRGRGRQRERDPLREGEAERGARRRGLRGEAPEGRPPRIAPRGRGAVRRGAWPLPLRSSSPRGRRPALLLPGLANRHGLVAGATGTGKTVTLRVLAEGFSRMGVPVFLADVKGDLSGLARPGGDAPKIVERARARPRSSPRPARSCSSTCSARRAIRSDHHLGDGPLLLARVLGLNETQAGVLQIAFRVADEDGLLLLDVKDLRAILEHVAERATSSARATATSRRRASARSSARSSRSSQQGGDRLFGEPALALDDLLRPDLGAAAR